MKARGATAALCLSAIFAAQQAPAETFSLASHGRMQGGDISFALLPDAPQNRIHLDQSMRKRAGAVRMRDIPLGTGSGPAAYLKHLIGWAEAGRKGYDAVQLGARRKPGKPPTHMTIGEIYQWIRETPGQPHAIGRYQFIPPTLKRLVREAGLTPGTVFSSQVQDLLADILLEDAGYGAFLAGRIGRHRFMENLAGIWAGFPTSTGRSYYHGHAGNRAVITWHEFDAHMRKIFPGERG